MGLEHLFAGWLASVIVENREKKKESYNRGATYNSLRSKYLTRSEATEWLLAELFRREPDLINGEIEADVRELLNIKVTSYSFKGQLHYGEAWFTISARNRFICEGLVDDLSTDYIRECELIDFSDRLFSPVANPYSQSISIGEYSFTFDHPFFYNMLLMLLLQADNRYQSGYRVSERAISAPEIFLDYEILAKHNVDFDEQRKENLVLTNAHYCTLNDFNAEKNSARGRKSGTIELRIINGKTYGTDHQLPISVSELRPNRSGFTNGNMWIDVGPDLMTYDGTKYSGVQFIFLEEADKVTIRGDEKRLTLYVCRLASGWGGIQFTVKNLTDYYRLAAWLVVAVSYAYDAETGTDWKESIAQYWPTYRALKDAQQNEGKSEK